MSPTIVCHDIVQFLMFVTFWWIAKVCTKYIHQIEIHKEHIHSMCPLEPLTTTDYYWNRFISFIWFGSWYLFRFVWFSDEKCFLHMSSLTRFHSIKCLCHKFILHVEYGFLQLKNKPFKATAIICLTCSLSLSFLPLSLNRL